MAADIVAAPVVASWPHRGTVTILTRPDELPTPEAIAFVLGTEKQPGKLYRRGPDWAEAYIRDPRTGGYAAWEARAPQVLAAIAARRAEGQAPVLELEEHPESSLVLELELDS
jgi:hypothetical protein